ncbi:hypothetical protein [Streptomyces sp. NPDC059479]|uniref:hypothetical protein n=1 Tax=Streptomyces sp. NPDC059479 TaxID=3346848 RepID=UPI0036821784
MNRRLSITLVAGNLIAQAMFLFTFHRVLLRVLGADSHLLVYMDFRLLGVDLDDFAVTEPGRISGWLPQLAFLVLSPVLTYAVLRGAPDARPRVRTVLELFGAMLLAAGIAELLGKAVDTAMRPPHTTYVEWFVESLKSPSAAPAHFALWSSGVLVIHWELVWRLRRWSALRVFTGPMNTADGGEQEQKPGPVLATGRERRHVVVAALIPVVLLAIAGGPVLRHNDVRRLDQPAITFDPELWLGYDPPVLIQKWGRVLYPALRLRPVPTENTPGWLATLAVCVVLLVVLAVALCSVAARAAGKRPLRVFMECWWATLLAAMVAAIVEAGPLSGVAPRGAAHAFEVSSAEAVRFGTVWGWVTGAAFLGMSRVLLTRRMHRTEPSADEGRLSHVE